MIGAEKGSERMAVEIKSFDENSPYPVLKKLARTATA